MEPLACVLSNLLKAGLIAGDHVLVLGGGPIGLLAAMTARCLGSPVTLAEQDEFRRKFAAEVLTGSFGTGVCVVASADAGGLPRFTAVVDTVGNQLASALPWLDDGGTVVVMGFDARAQATVRPLEIVQRGLRIIGAGDYHSQIFRRAIDVAAMLPLSKLVTHRFTLDEHEAAFRTLACQEAEAYSAVKVVIEGRVEGKAREVAA